MYGMHLIGWQLVGTLQAMAHQFVGRWVQGTTLMPMYMRLLGGEIGDGVFWAADVPAEVGIFTVGDGAVVESGAMLVGHVVDHGRIQHMPTVLGKGSYVGAGSHVQPGVVLGEGVMLWPGTLAMKGEVFPRGSSWQGSPAVVVEGDLGNFIRQPAIVVEDLDCRAVLVGEEEIDKVVEGLVGWEGEGGKVNPVVFLAGV